MTPVCLQLFLFSPPMNPLQITSLPGSHFPTNTPWRLPFHSQSPFLAPSPSPYAVRLCCFPAGSSYSSGLSTYMLTRTYIGLDPLSLLLDSLCRPMDTLLPVLSITVTLLRLPLSWASWSSVGDIRAAAVSPSRVPLRLWRLALTGASLLFRLMQLNEVWWRLSLNSLPREVCLYFYH
jgi:hypothetical protein